MPRNTVAVPLPSASSVAATASTGAHVLKLSGYSQAKLLVDTGSFIESAEFKAAGHSWRIRVYPNGASSDCRPGCMSIYLMLSGQSEDKVHAHFQFSFVHHGKLTVTPHDCIISKPVTFDQGDMCCWGFDDVRTKELLEDAEYFKDHAIIIRCDITVLNKPVVKRRYPDMSELLCDCNDNLCINLHAGDNKAAAASRKPQSHFVPHQTHTGYLPLSNHAAPLPSASTITVTASTGCHVLNVTGYSQARLLLGNGKYIESAKFKMAGHTWRIRCYPNGDREESAGHISLYLELAGESTNVRTHLQFSLVKYHIKFLNSLIISKFNSLNSLQKYSALDFTKGRVHEDFG
ncbi:hypothetical protein EJB05_08026, partial [Eragrostis curvula]